MSISDSTLPLKTLYDAFGIDPNEEIALRRQANLLSPAAIISDASSPEEFLRQLMIPNTVMELARKTQHVRLAGWEVEAIRASLEKGLLFEILQRKQADDTSHPPYIRVACSGRGDYDHLYKVMEQQLEEPSHAGDFGAAAVLEIWPAGHYSPIHSHGKTTGIVYGLAGQIDVMAYESLAWDARKLGLLTVTPGQCAWLSEKHFPVHKVFCPMTKGNFAATFHVYVNQDELPLLQAMPPRPDTRDQFDYIDEDKPHSQKTFATYSDLSWHVLRKEMLRFQAANSRHTD